MTKPLVLIATIILILIALILAAFVAGVISSIIKSVTFDLQIYRYKKHNQKKEK